MFKVTRTKIKLPKLQQSLPVLLVDMPHSQSVTTMFLANAGSRYESKKEQGLAHFFEHMVFKGTKKYPNSQTLSVALDSVGADFNAFTSKEYTGYYVKTAREHVGLAIDVLSDMLFQPLLEQKEIDKEKGVIVEELNMYVDNPAYHVSDVFDQLFFASEDLAHSIVGRKATIRSFNSQDFLDFTKRFYNPDNLLLVVAGGLEGLKDSLQDLLQEALLKIPEGRAQGTHVQPRLQDATSSLATQKGFSKQRFKLIKRDSQQAHFVMAWPSLHTHHEDRYVLQVLSTIIGGNMSSRLFAKVREERGLAYYVNSNLDFYHDVGAFGCSAGVDLLRAAEAVEVSRAVFEDVASGREPITADELAKAKEYLRGKTLLSLESSNSVAQFFGLKQVLRGDQLDVDEILSSLQKVSLQDLQRVASQVIDANQPRLAIIGDFSESVAKALRSSIN